MLITILKPFKFAHQGIHVQAFEVVGEVEDTTDECAQLAIAEGWAEAYVEPVQTPAPAPAPAPEPEPDVEPGPAPLEAAAADQAPENRDASAKPVRTKRAT